MRILGPLQGPSTPFGREKVLGRAGTPYNECNLTGNLLLGLGRCKPILGVLSQRFDFPYKNQYTLEQGYWRLKPDLLSYVDIIEPFRQLVSLGLGTDQIRSKNSRRYA